MKKITSLKKKLFLIGGTVAGLTIPLVLTSCSDSLNEVVSNSILSNNGTSFSNSLSLKDVATKALYNNPSQIEMMDKASSKMALDWFKRLSTTGNATFRNLYNDQVKKVNDEYDSKLSQYKKDYPKSWSARFQQEVLDPKGGTESSYKDSQMLEWAKNEIQSRIFGKSFLTIIDNKTGNAVQNITGTQLLDILLNDNNTTTSGSKNGTNGYSFGFASKLSQAENDTAADKEYSKFQKFVYDRWIQFSNPYVINMSLWKYTTPGNGINSVYSAAPQSTSSGDDSTGDSSDGTTTTQSSTREGESGGDTGSGDGSDTTTPSTSGTYAFPYFKSQDDNDNPGSTIGKFKAFVEASKKDKNFKEKTAGSTTTPAQPSASKNGNNNTAESLGLKKIPKIYTDDSSTYILAKNSSIFNDLYIEFAAASSYLYSMVGNGTQSQAPTQQTQMKTGADGSDSTINTTIGKKLDMPTNGDSGGSGGNGSTENVLDLITRQFVSKTSFNATEEKPEKKETQTVTTKFNETHLSKELVNEIINSSGELSSLRNNDLYSIDSFMITDTGLNEYMLLRNEAGVHAISIDGWDYIKKASDKLTANKRAGNVVLYRYFQNKMNIDSDVTITDINNELSTFFKDNFSYLVYSYAEKATFQEISNQAKSTSLKITTTTKSSPKEGESTNNSFDSDENKQSLFNIASVTSDENFKKLLSALNTYLFELSKYTYVDDYNKKMIDAKRTYSKNYGANTKTNGLASPWVYATNASDKSNYYFDVAKQSGLVSDPFTKPQNSAPLVEKADANNNKSSYQKLDDSIKTYIGSANFTTGLKSNFEGFKYSQYVYSDNWLINYALLKFGTDGDSLSFAQKESILKEYTKDIYDYDNLSFKSSNNNPQSKLTLNGVNTYLDSGLSNYFFSNTFIADELNWYYWDKFTAQNKTTGKQETNGATFDKNNLAKYWKYLWQEKTKIKNSSSGLEYNNLYTIVATTKYLLENDGKYFIDYLNAIIPYGAEAYITWQNSQNTLLQETKQATVKDLVDASKISQNINNSYFSSYVGNYSSTTSGSTGGAGGGSKAGSSESANTTNSGILLNNKGSLFNDESNYYKVVGDSLGFMGIQTSTSNSLSSVISSRLFSNQKANNASGNGILYGYESKDKLANYIMTLSSSSQVESTANNLKSKIPSLNISKIISKETTLKDKKELLSKLVKDNGNIPETYFNERSGYIGNANNTNSTSTAASGSSNTNSTMNVTPIPDVSNGNNAIEYGAKVIQINSKDINNSGNSNGKNTATISNLVTTISNKLKKINGTDSSSKQTETNNMNTQASEIVYNLLINAATNSSVQQMALNSILSSRKVSVNDIRLNNQLGADWVSNWIYKPDTTN